MKFSKGQSVVLKSRDGELEIRGVHNGMYNATERIHWVAIGGEKNPRLFGDSHWIVEPAPPAVPTENGFYLIGPEASGNVFRRDTFFDGGQAIVEWFQAGNRVDEAHVRDQLERWPSRAYKLKIGEAL